MLNKPLQKEEILSSNEITFDDRQEFNYPQLMRLAMDFEFCVLQLPSESYNCINKCLTATTSAFVLTSRNYQTNCVTYSPRCNSLRELEVYACIHHVDILHEHLFGKATAENDLLAFR
ncbi:MAG: hypothetical protein V4660_07360 [Pseudomonadota bacterium]